MEGEGKRGFVVEKNEGIGLGEFRSLNFTGELESIAK